HRPGSGEVSAHREQRGGTEVARREEEDARGAARREDEQRPEDVVEGEEGAQAEQDDEDAAPGPALVEEAPDVTREHRPQQRRDEEHGGGEEAEGGRIAHGDDLRPTASPVPEDARSAPTAGRGSRADPSHDCLTAYASSRPTAYTPPASPGGTRAAPCAPCASCSTGYAGLRGERGNSDAYSRSAPGTVREGRDGHERRAHGRDHHARTGLGAAGGGADRRHLPAPAPAAQSPVGGEAFRRLRRHRLGRRRAPHRPRGSALGARL